MKNAGVPGDLDFLACSRDESGKWGGAGGRQQGIPGTIK